MSILLINANSLHIPLADESVNCVVTSPPYYGLRDYGTARWNGGDTECDHLRPRLQLSALEEFYEGKKTESNVNDLPLFMDTQ